jgi:hypothetical protein
MGGHVDQPVTINLGTLARGAVSELFAEELRRVGENVLDVNTEPAAARKIKVELTFTPDEDRREVPVKIRVSSTLAPMKGAKTRVYFGREADGLAMAEEDGRQGDLFHPVEPAAADAAVIRTEDM